MKAIAVLAAYLIGAVPIGWMVARAFGVRRHPAPRQRHHRRHQRAAHAGTAGRPSSRCSATCSRATWRSFAAAALSGGDPVVTGGGHGGGGRRQLLVGLPGLPRRQGRGDGPRRAAVDRPVGDAGGAAGVRGRRRHHALRLARLAPGRGLRAAGRRRAALSVGVRRSPRWWWPRSSPPATTPTSPACAPAPSPASASASRHAAVRREHSMARRPRSRWTRRVAGQHVSSPARCARQSTAPATFVSSRPSRRRRDRRPLAGHPRYERRPRYNDRDRRRRELGHRAGRSPRPGR